MTQRQILENSIDLLKTLRGPAKLLYAAGDLPMPSIIENVINPTTGAPAPSWTPFGLTRGGINVAKNLDIAVRDDVDQIFGAYDQDITDESHTITTQIAEVLLDQSQLAVALDLGSATVVSGASTTVQSRRMLSGGSNKTTERRWAAIFPKATNGKVFAYVFRRGAVSGGEKTMRFDKSDAASPALELRFFPEIATTIASDEKYGLMFEIQ